ncbi:MAG: VCBS repeat-containing protein [Acidobacteriales bacterium]|nr:VCBS repeat-containing protein [Terriglobales bacterium]
MQVYENWCARRDSNSRLLNNGDGTFGSETDYTVGENDSGLGGHGMAVGDFNQDGFPDLAVGEAHSYSSAANLLLNTGAR